MNIHRSVNGTSFDLHTPMGNRHVKLQLVGIFNVYNVLAAISVGLAANVPLDDIVESLSVFKGVPGRFELVDEQQDFSVIVDYAHTPDGFGKCIKTVKINGFRIFVVVVAAETGTGQNGQFLSANCLQIWGYSVFTSDNPRTERSDTNIKRIWKQALREEYEVIPDRKRQFITRSESPFRRCGAHSRQRT